MYVRFSGPVYNMSIFPDILAAGGTTRLYTSVISWRVSPIYLLDSQQMKRDTEFPKENETLPFYYPELVSKLIEIRRFIKFDPMIHFTCPVSGIIHRHMALYPLSMHNEFLFLRILSSI